MAFSENERKKYEILVSAFVEKRRPSENIRDQLDIGYRIEGQSVEIFEIRPAFNNPDVKMESPVAKATYVRTQRVWKVHWQKSDLKWHSYPLESEVRNLEKFLELVDDDELCCFWG